MIQHHKLVRQFLEPVEQEIFKETGIPIKLIDLRLMSFIRNSFSHHDIRTIVAQRCLIQKCKQTTYPQNYQYTSLLKKIVDHLEMLDSGVPTKLVHLSLNVVLFK